MISSSAHLCSFEVRHPFVTLKILQMQHDYLENVDACSPITCDESSLSNKYIYTLKSTCSSLSMSLSVSVSISLCLSLSVSVCLSVCLSLSLSLFLSVSVCLSVSLSLCHSLSFSLSLVSSHYLYFISLLTLNLNV